MAEDYSNKLFRSADGNVIRFYTWAPSTENFEGHDTLEEATEYARTYGDYGGPCYVFELKDVRTSWPSEEEIEADMRKQIGLKP